ncbi:MAG: hypothetical protein AAGD25_08220 [Cyanobacteria bacterium P01_F01_bin.150]
MTECKLYLAAPHDAEAIARIHYRAVRHNDRTSEPYREKVLRAWSPDVTQERVADWRESLLGNDELFFCATNNSGIVGFSSIKLRTTQADLEQVLGSKLPEDITPAVLARIGNLYGSADTPGVGTFMYNQLETVAISCGKNAIVLNSSLNAVKFYRNKGFSMLNPENSYSFDKQTAMVCAGMIKRLT